MYVEVDVDIDDIYYSMSKREKQELLDTLIDDGFKPSKNEYKPISNDFDEACYKMIGNCHALSMDDEKIILSVANKIIV